MSDETSSVVRSALIAGSIIALLDGTAACLNAYLLSGTMPAGVFRYVASGAFGKEAFTGGGVMVMWGISFHVFIAMSWTALFYFLYPRIGFLSANAWLVGMGYGLLIWFLMNSVVVPLSQIHPPPFRFSRAWIMILIHCIVIGIPIVQFTRWFYQGRH